MNAVGRRPGNADTRGAIVEAAKRVFAAKGYDGASLRAIAREAGVDPALVHHYFDGKASLFVAAMALPFDPRHVQEQSNSGSSGSASSVTSVGAGIIMGFLTMWDEAEGSGSSFAACVAGMAASTSVADAMREFVAERVWQNSPTNPGESAALTQSAARPRLLPADGTGLHPLHPACAAGLDGRHPGRSPAGPARPSTATSRGSSTKSLWTFRCRAGPF